MNNKEICKIIKKVEKKNLKNFYIQNINFIPILRLSLLEVLAQPKKNYNENSIFIFITKLNQLFVSLFNYFFYFYLNKKKNKYSKSIIISRKNALVRFKKDELIYDKIFDPLIKKKKIKNTIKIYLDCIINPRNLAIKNIYYPWMVKTNFLKKKILIPKNILKILNHISKDLNINKTDLLSKFQRKIEIFFYWKNKSKNYFNNFPNIRSVFFNCWYSPEFMAIIYEAKNRNIKTIDVQHGIQGKFHPMYSCWVNVKNYNYKLVPDKFWCWDKFSKKNMKDGLPNKQFHVPILKNEIHDIIFKKRSTIKKNYKKIILFSLQKEAFSHDNFFPKFIDEFLKEKLNNNDLFIFRPQPNVYESQSKFLKNKIKYYSKKNILLDDCKYSFQDLLTKATHHITAFSTTSLEARLYGLKSIVFGEESKIVLQDYIKNKNLIWIRSNKNNLKKALDKN
ncbi:hypothetical protein OAN14_04295 [Candidatus Pelagibacter sp.]|nr:hypothetical protein [Candidatus Pelagibacter sp.]